MEQKTKLVIFFVALLLFDKSCLSDSPACTLHSSSGKFISSDYCTDSTAQYCRVDPKTGYGLGCVSASQCPSNVTDQTLVCNSTIVSCCCKENNYGDDYDFEGLCNDLLSQDYDDVWKQACKLQELMNLPICTGPNPTLSVFCAKSEDNGQNEECPGEKRYCGIDRKTGDLQGCVSQAQCPGNVKDGEIVCQADKPSCCCLGKSDNTNPLDKQLACNNILKDRGTSSIWKQACGLPELKALLVCEKLTTTTEPPITGDCLAYCKTKKSPDVNGPFEIVCGHVYGVGGSKKRQCKGDCPQGCLCDYTGYELKLKCPEIPPEPPEPIKYRTDIETYVAVVLMGLIGLGIIAGIIYAIIMKTIKKRKREQVIGDPFALTHFYQNYPRPPGVVEMAQREESLKAQESKVGTEGQPEAEK